MKTMQNNDIESDSDESTAASIPEHRSYRCPRCWRTFSSGQALGGHQNAHRFDKVVQRVTNIVSRRNQAAELRPRPRPPPRQQMVDESGSNELTNIEKDHDQDHGHDEHQQHQYDDDDQGDHQAVVDGNGSDIANAKCDDDNVVVVVVPQEINITRRSSTVLTTRDFLGEWMPVYKAGKPQEVEKSSQRTLSHPVLKVSRTALPGEETTSQKNDDHPDLDLDFKLGF